MTCPPPCFLVPSIWRGSIPGPCSTTQTFPQRGAGQTVKGDSSLQRARRQRSTGQSLCSFAHFLRALLCSWVIAGFLTFFFVFTPCSWRRVWTFLESRTGLPSASSTNSAAWGAYVSVVGSVATLIL